MAISSTIKRAIGGAFFYSILGAVWAGMIWLYLNHIYWPQRDMVAFTDHQFWGWLSWVPFLDTAPYLTLDPVRYELSELKWLGILCGIPFFALISRFTLTDLPWLQRGFNIFVRAALVIALVGSLLQLHRTEFETHVATIFIVDVSESVPDKTLKETQKYIQGVYDQKKNQDSIKLITFSKRPRLIRLADGKIPELARHPEDTETLERRKRNQAQLEREKEEQEKAARDAAAEAAPKEDATAKDKKAPPKPPKTAPKPDETEAPKEDAAALAAAEEKEALANEVAAREATTQADSVNQHTNIQAALRLAYGMFPPENLKRIVLISDGNQTEGDLLGEAFNARTYGIRIYTKHFEIKPRHEMMISHVTIKGRDNLRVDQPFEVEVEVFSTHPEELEYDLKHRLGEYSLSVDKSDPIRYPPKIKQGENYITLEVTPHKPGGLDYRIDLQIDGCKMSDIKGNAFATEGCKDHYFSNNYYKEKLEINDKPNILYVEGDSRRSHFLRRGLEGDGKSSKFKVHVRRAGGLPHTIDEALQFDAIILSDAPVYDSRNNRTNVTIQQMKVLDNYVRRYGGGFIAIGGERSFGMGGYQDTLVEKLLPVSFDAKKTENQNHIGLALVIDKSGSMQGQKMDLAKDAAKKTVEVLGKRDKVMIIGFDDTPQKYVPLQRASNRMRILNRISTIRADGGTDIEPALEVAYLDLAMASAKIKHVILLSDGQSNYGNIASLVRQMRDERITVSTVAVGSGADAVLLRQIADLGGGRFYSTTDPSSIPRIFLQETSLVTKNAVVEEPFRPRVAKKHPMTKGLSFSSAPDLLGYVTTKARRSAEVLLKEPYRGAPILATWKQGLGNATVFTSDAKNRWATAWVNTRSFYPKFWSQVVRTTMRRDKQNFLPMIAELQRGQGMITVDAIDNHDLFIKDLDSTIRIVPPQVGTCDDSEACVTQYGEGWYCSSDYRKVRRAESEPVYWDTSRERAQCFTESALTQTAPGIYEEQFDLLDFGPYYIEAVHYRPNKKGKFQEFGRSRSTLSYPFPMEYFFLKPNRAIIDKVTQITEGGLDPSFAKLFDPEDQKIKRQEPLWRYFLYLALIILIIDILFRRVRFYGRTNVAWEKVAGRGR